MPAKIRKKARPTPQLLRRLHKHFVADPSGLPVLEQQFKMHERPNLQLALEEMLARPGQRAELVGVVTSEQYRIPSLGRLSQAVSAAQFEQGPVEYVDTALAAGRHLACVKTGLYLVHDQDVPLALLLTVPMPHLPTVHVEVMAAEREQAEQFLRELAHRTSQGKAYRGHVLSIEENCHRQVVIRAHDLPAVRRDELILPDALIQRVERHTLGFTKHQARLRAAGRHLKRGILLYGPPGTGKTLTAMYLVTQMPGRTVLLLTGHGIQSIETACRLARLLEPATVVLEDVDLIGTERDQQTVGANALLFELLNEMEGLAEDADILFVLTSNRPEILEPALAARPGRVDQAIEIPPPDADCRRRLFELYGRGVELDVADWDRFIARTEGVTGAFIRELLRKACIYAAEEDGAGPLLVRDRHLDEALAELLIAGGPLTKSLLGARAHGTESKRT